MDFEMLPRSQASRVFPLDDIEVLRAEQGGDGRTVRAYAAVYDKPVVVNEFGEKFEEAIRARAFARTIEHMGTRFQVLFNHGMTLYGTPAERYAMPIGTPLSVSDEPRGVLTVTRYAKTPLADEVLELIKSDAIRGQSFRGEWVTSRLIRRGGLGGLDRVDRTEVSMREYGPTPFPVYETAKILSVRSSALVEELRALSDEDRAALLAEIAGTSTPPAEGTGSESPPVETTPETPPAENAPAAGPSLESLAIAQAQRLRKQPTEAS